MTLALKVFPGVIISQLVLGGVQDKPSLFPALDSKVGLLVEVALVNDLTVGLLRRERGGKLTVEVMIVELLLLLLTMLLLTMLLLLLMMLL